MKKELIEKMQYVIMFDNKDLQARYQKLSNEIILRKIKGGAKRRQQSEFYIIGRKPYAQEGAFKDKLLYRMGVGRWLTTGKGEREVCDQGHPARPNCRGTSASNPSEEAKTLQQIWL